MASSIASMQYTPGPVPTNSADLPRYLKEEFDAIKAAIDRVAEGYFPVVYSPPAKPRVGMVRNADGVMWNPGAGGGLYRYDGTWKFLG